MDNLFSKESELLKSLDEHFKKVKAIQKLPQYAEFLKYKEELDLFKDFINNKRVEKTHALIDELIEENSDLIETWLNRIRNLERKLSDSAWRRHETFCSSNIMNHIWKVAKKYGTPTQAQDMFDQEAFTLGRYTIAMYSGQGEYGYAVYVNKRIF